METTSTTYLRLTKPKRRKSFCDFLFSRILFFLILIGAIYNNISAQDSDSIRTYILDETVVTGTRLELKQYKLPISISVINQNQIEKIPEVNVLPLINNSIPGLFLNNRNVLGYGVGPISSGQISIRGIGENPNSGILVLVDGQPQFMGIFGHPINDSYLNPNIERIEVIRGPASLLYGSNAFGGAINIITKKQESEGLLLQSSFSYGSYNTSMFSGRAGYKNHGLNFIASFTGSRTDGHRKDGDDDFKSNSVFSKLSYSFGENYSISVDGNMTDSKFYDPGPENAVKKNNFYDYLRGRAALSFENKFEITEGAVKLFYNYGKHDFFDGWHSTDNLKGITIYQSLKFCEENIFTAGVEYKNFGGKCNNDNVPPPAAKGLNKNLNIDEVEGYGIFQFTFFSNINFSSGLRITKNSVTGFEYTPQLGFSYVLNNSTIIKGNAGKAFRSPTIADLFLFPPSNENLQPERIWTYELGLTKFIIENLFKSELTFFYIEADNLIQQISIPGQKINTGSFNNKGIELTFSLLPINSFSSSLIYSYLHTSKILPYAPEHKLNLHLEYSFNIFTLSSDLQSIYNLYTNGGNKKEDYTILSLSIHSSLTGWLTFFAKGANLTNKKYYIDEGYPSPGITFLAGIKVSY